MTGSASSVSVLGDLLDGADTNTYTVLVNDGNVFDFYLRGTSGWLDGYISHPALLAVDPAGNGLGQSVSGGGVGPDVTIQASADGIMTVTVSDPGGTGGHYELVIENRTFSSDLRDYIGGGPRLAIGDTLVSSIYGADDADFVRVNLQAGLLYMIDARGSATGDGTLSDPVLQLFDRYGSVVASDDDSGVGTNAFIQFIPQASGDFWIRVDGYSSHSGSYELQVSAPHVDSVPGDITTPYELPLGNTIQGSVDHLADSDVYSIRLLQGATYIFDLAGVSHGGTAIPNPFLTLLDNHGNGVAADLGSAIDPAHISFTAGYSGVYFVKAQDFVAGTGSYDLSVKLQAPTDGNSANVASYDQGSAYHETITGSAHDDYRLIGTQGKDSIDGGLGKDTMVGAHGNDIYVVDNIGDHPEEGSNGGIDTVKSSVSFTLPVNIEKLTLTGASAINGTGNELGNVLSGNTAANVLDGAAGSDTVNGGAGNDTVIGGAGKDVLNGGGDLDRFVFKALSDSGPALTARDEINAFAHGDKIDVSAIDANGGAAGNQAFAFVDAFTHVAGQLQADGTEQGGYLVQGDTNGDGVTDFSIQLHVVSGFGSIQSGDFIL